MANPAPVPSPIQVVLNAQSFVEDWTRQGGGEFTDFFEGRDAAFVQHQRAVLAQVTNTRQTLARPEHPGVAFLKVSVRPPALAKSHRPVRALFRADRAPALGAGAPGELIFAVTADTLGAIAGDIQGAEPQTRYKEKVDKKKPDKAPKRVANPSRPRSEVGAIESVALWSASDRRRFSVDQALAWLADPRTGGFYLVELFEPPAAPHAWDLLAPAHRRLFHSFHEVLAQSGAGVRAMRLPLLDTKRALFAVWLLVSDAPPQVFWEPVRALPTQRNASPVDLSPERHRRLLQRLDEHPLVKHVHLPPIVERQHAPAERVAPDARPAWPVAARVEHARYPRVAVVDGGLASCLDDWIVDRWPFVAPADESLDHGTFIGGLLVGGRSLNAPGVIGESDGCELIDIKLLPGEADPGAFARYYGTDGAIGFFQELNDAVATLRQRANVRVFNLSANFQTMADPTRYNPLTAELDGIAEAHDVVFVVSAGNADGGDCRDEWPTDPVTAMAILAGATQDRVRSPAESVRNLSVGALNPPHLAHVIGHAPAAYSRRGPGLTSGLKPDVAHVGGAGTPHDGDHGLWSITPAGQLCSSAGTSYAAPLVAKTLAAIAHGIEGDVSRETLIALLLHHSQLPTVLTNPAYGRAARDLVGFGLPMNAEPILLGSDHQITMVFAARLTRNRRLEFGFTWPASLSDPEGRCRGYAHMTLVATPPLDPRAEAELVRVDVNAHLKQDCANGAHASSGWLPMKGGKKKHQHEIRLIAEALKWSPAKIYQWRSKAGQGRSTNWRLTVDHLSRDDDSMPPEGVPFTVLVTIADLDGQAPVFQELRQSLQAQGAQLEQIQTAARVSPRV